MIYSASNIAFLVFAIALVAVALYSIMLVVSSLHIIVTARDLAVFSLIMFLFGFLIASYIDLNTVDLFIGGVLLIILALYFSYRSIKRKLLDNKAKEVLGNA